MRRAIGLSAVIACAAVVAACGGGGSGTSGGSSAAVGSVIQGPVSGATVWADRISSTFPIGNNVLDPDEISTTTDVKGSFNYPGTPGYAHLSRSRGGIDTITNKAALPMSAPAGVRNITPLTSLVASLPPNADGSLSTGQQALKTKIETVMGNLGYDADPTKQITPAALALTKAVEVSLSIARDAVAASASTGGAPTAAQLAQAQGYAAAEIIKAIATEIAKPATTTSTLSSAATLASTVATATRNAATTMNGNTGTGNLVFYSPTALASAVQTAVNSVATTIALQSGQTAADLGTAAYVKEADVIQPIQTQIEAATTIATATTSDTIAVIVPKTVVDTTPPTVMDFSPAAGAVNVPLNTYITITFTKAMDPATLIPANFTITAAGAAAVTPAVTYNSTTRTVTLTPGTSLAAGKSYTTTIGPAVKDLSAKLPLPSTSVKSWSFTTATAPDTVPPVATIRPVNQATEVPTTAQIMVSFDKAVNPATVNTGTVTLKAGAETVAGAVKYDGSSRTATFVPALPLKYATDYTVSLSGITSVSGSVIAPTTSGFRSAGNPDTTRPTVTGITVEPAGENGRIGSMAEFVAAFSEQISIATLNATSFSVKLKSDGSIIPGSVLYNSATRTARFTPAVPLPASGTLVTTLSASITDLAGNGLGANVRNEFVIDPVITGSQGGTQN